MTPKPRVTIFDNLPGVEGLIFQVDHYFYAAKHKGNYKLKHRMYLRKNKVDNKRQILETLKRDTEQYIKKGRYTDFYYTGVSHA